MKTKTMKKLLILVVSGILTISMTSAVVLAAGPSAAPDMGSLQVQNKSSDTAVLTLGKILTVNQDGKFPKVTDFHFSIERVGGWDNASADTAQSGRTMQLSEVPMPAASGTAHQKVTVNGDLATVEIGDFSSAGAGNTVTGTADSSKVRGRTAPVQIRFQKAGWYVYKVKEISSSPEHVKGVDYDTHEYFMVIYVCNKIDAQGNTTDGVYVHDITSYRNEAGSTANRPDLSDIQNMTDNGGTAAGTNDEETLAKVGHSSSDTPDHLEAYRMWNYQWTHDIVLVKNVTGNLGDRTKAFEFTVSLKGLEPGQIYTTSTPSEDGQSTAAGVTLTDCTAGSLEQQGTAVKADEQGRAVFKVKLTDDQKLVINALPVTAVYRITEAASDHVASFAVTSSAPQDTPAVIAAASAANTASDTALSTSEETVDKQDAAITITYTNNRDLAVITGLGSMLYFYLAGFFLLLAVLLLAARNRRRMPQWM